MGKRRTTGKRSRPPAAASPTRRDRDWRLPAFLGALFVVKLIALSQLQHHPLLQPDAGLDTASYVELARRVLDGDILLGPGLYYQSPLYIYFLAMTLGVSGSFAFVRIVQIALGTAAAGCAFLAARAWFGPRAGWIAAWLVALTGVFTFYEIVLFQSSLDTFLTAAGLALLARALTGPSERDHPAGARRSERRWALSAGVVLGLQILNRPNVAIAVAGLAVALLLIRRIRMATLFAAGACLALAPVVARNAVVSHQFALASSQGGLNFYIGNNASATGQYAAVPGVRASIEGQAEDTRRVAEAAAGHALTDAEVSSYFSGLALTWIRTDPAAAVRLFVKKLALTFNARHQWLDFSYPYYAHDAGTLLGFLFVGPWLLVPLGLAGLAAVPRPAGREYLAWATFVPCYAVGVAIFFVGERYRLPLMVALCITGAGAADRLLAAIRDRARPGMPRASLAAGVALLAAGTALTAWPFSLNSGRYDERLRLSKTLMNRGDYGAAAIELQKAYKLDPSNTVAEFNLGMALVSSGRGQEGIAHARHAVDAGVPVAGARYALASAMLATGDRVGAVALLRTFSPAPDEDAQSCYQVGLLAISADAPRVAERYLRRALELRPGWPDAQGALAQIVSR